jgi:hypothetical protein
MIRCIFHDDLERHRKTGDEEKSNILTRNLAPRIHAMVRGREGK